MTGDRVVVGSTAGGVDLLAGELHYAREDATNHDWLGREPWAPFQMGDVELASSRNQLLNGLRAVEDEMDDRDLLQRVTKRKA